MIRNELSMKQENNSNSFKLNNHNSRVKRWSKLLAGVLFLIVMAAFFSSGYSPPGIFGQVLRHNQKYNIDASPLFYTDVENMTEIEEELILLMKKEAQ